MLTRVARMYHEERLLQREIALRLSLSQSRVSRLLRRAVEVGVVRTVVVSPPGVHSDLEDALRAAYGLRDAVVVDGDTPAALGAAAATYLDSTVAPGDRIGIASWSATLRDALVKDPAVAGVMAGWDELTLALVGIGGLEPSALLEQSGNAIGDAELDALRERGAVGDICFRFFDAHGSALPSALDGRVLGIAPERLHAIPRRVGVAGGAQKYPAVRAALRGNWINVLITDAASAHRLAEERP
jgi:DNA-binding transcriptional regulator LsrR (DeoR family)